MPGKFSSNKLVGIVRESLAQVPDPRSSTNRGISLIDCLMSAYAMFSLKSASLLQFDQRYREDITRHNLKSLYQIDRAPSDTYMRERLDEVDPKELRKAFKKLLAEFQRSNYLKLFEFYQGRYLLPLDGTGYFSSNEVHCENCCEKHHKDGHTSYYHQMLSGALVHPDYNVSLPFAPEPIMKSDGAKKNGCERNAAKRFLKEFRREHPHMKVIITGDGLFSNGPFIKQLTADKHRYILVAKEKDHQHLFEEFNALAKDEHQMTRGDVQHRFRYMNGLAINDSHPDCLVNVLEYWEISAQKGKEQHWAWVTDIPLTKETVYQVMRGGRARHKIENETFNTLKNQGYQFEHNFGHGKKHLSTVFAQLLNLAFFVDQLQQLCCSTFKRAVTKLGNRKRVWEKQRELFFGYFIGCWDTLMGSLAYGHKGAVLEVDSS